MLLEMIAGGLLFMGSTAVYRRTSLPSVRSLLPSKTLRGSPEDLDPNEVAVNLVISRMIRNISAVEICSDRITYSDDKVSSFSFLTHSYFTSSYWTTSNFSLSIKSGSTVIKIDGPNNKIASAVSTVVKLKKEYDHQKAKELENKKAFALIEALTDAKPEAEGNLYELNAGRR